jgi:hypothetical protein
MSKWIVSECYTISDINKVQKLVKSFGARLIDFIVNRDNTCSFCIEYDDEKKFSSIESFIELI